MREILRMQVRQILGGRMKIILLVMLLLPVLLTVALVGAGGFEELDRELRRDEINHSLAAHELPDAARRLDWQGEDVHLLGGRWVLGEQGLRFRGRPLSEDWVYVVNDGYLVYIDGGLWIDDSKRPMRESYHIRRLPRGHGGPAPSAEPQITLDTLGALYLFLLYPQVICLLISLFYGTSVLGHELGGKTLTYLFTRALPRWKFVLGKYLGILAVLAIPASLSLLASWVILGVGGGLEVLAVLLGGTLAALVSFNALFVLFGFLVPRRALVVALLYGVVFELVLSFVPALVNKFTITYYLRSFVVGRLDIQVPVEVVRVVGGASPRAALLALVTISAGALAASCLLAKHREYVIRDQA